MAIILDDEPPKNKNHLYIYMFTINILYKLVLYFRVHNYEPVHEISNNLVCATSKASDQPAHT